MRDTANPEVESAESDGLGMFRALRDHWWVVAACVMVAVAVGLLYSGFQSTKYAATAKVLFDDTETQLQLFDAEAERVDPIRRLLNEEQRMRNSDVRLLAAEIAGVTDPTGLSVTIAAAPTNDLIQIKATSGNADQAAVMANAVVQAYEQIVTEERRTSLADTVAQLDAYRARLVQQVQEADAQLLEIRAATEEEVEGYLFIPSEIRAETDRRLATDPTYTSLQQQRAIAQANLDEATADYEEANIFLSLAGSGVEAVEPARVPGSPIQPQPVRNAALAGMVGLLAGAGIAWRRADKLAPVDARGIEAKLGTPRFGTLPSRRGRDGAAVDLSAISELAGVGRVLSAALFHRLQGLRGQTVVVTSLEHGDGRTLTSIILGLAAARTGRSVAVLDADPETRGLSHAANAEQVAGLAELLRREVVLDDILHRFPLPDVRSLYLVPAGVVPLDPAAIMRGDVGQPLRSLARRLDILIVDAPPLLSSAAAVELAGAADSVILVVKRDVPTADLEEAKRRLELLDANVIGFVVNDLETTPEHPPRIQDIRHLGEVPLGELISAPREDFETTARIPVMTPPPSTARAAEAEEEAPVPSSENGANGSSGVVGSTPLGFTLRRPSR